MVTLVCGSYLSLSSCSAAAAIAAPAEIAAPARFRYITFPYLVPTLTVNLVLMVKQGFTSFDFAFALTGGGPVRATEVIGILIYNDAFKNMRFGMANAEACILFVVVAAFSLTQLKLTSKGGVRE